METEY